MSDPRPPSDPGSPHENEAQPLHDEVVARFERNLSKLLRGAYRPQQPDPAFQTRMLMRMRARQRQGLGPRRRWLVPAVAAAALLGISLWFVVRQGFAPQVETATGVFLATAHEAGWQRTRGTIDVRPRDCLALGPGDAAVVRPSPGTQLRLEPGAILQCATDRGADRTTRDLLLRGNATVTVSDEETHILAAPILEITARGAEYSISVTERPPLSPLSQEYLEMNKAKIITGSVVALGAVVLVSIMVHRENEPDSVTVSYNGQRVGIETGVTTTFGSPDDAPEGVADPDRSVAAGSPSTPDTNTSTATATSAGAAEDAAHRRVQGMVVDRAGQPLAGASIVLRTKGEGGSEIAGPVSSDPAGAFTLTVPADASGDIVARMDRYESASVPLVPVATDTAIGDSAIGDTAAGPVADMVAAGNPGPASSRVGGEPATSDTEAGVEEPEDASVENEDANVVIITLDHETAFAGHVREASSGEPVDSFLLGYQRFEDSWQWFEPVVKSQPSADGSFYAGGLDPGRYRIWVYREGYSRSEPTTINLARGDFIQGLEVALELGVGLTVRVFSERTGAAVANAVVYSHLDHLPGTINYVDRTDVDTRLRSSGKSDASGVCNLNDLRAGAHYVRILHPDYAPREVELELAAEEQREIDVTLTEGSSIFGSVIDTNGEPMEGASVLAITMTARQDLAQISRGEVDAEGRYTVRNLTPGPYVVVRLSPRSQQDSKVSMSFVNAGKDTQVDFVEVATLATLRGRIVDERGDPIAKMSVSAGFLDPVTGFDFKSGVTDETGHYEIRNLSPKTYSVSVAENFSYSSSVVGEIEIERPIDYDADYTVYDIAIEGRVTAMDGTTPLADVELILLRLKDGVPTDFAGRGVSNSAGRYDIRHVQPGEYQLLASGENLAPELTKTFELAAGLSRKTTHDFTLAVGAGVRVQVVDPNDAPLSGANVIVRDASGEFLNQGLPPRTDGDGKYSFTRLLAGPHRLEISLEGRLPATAEFEATIGSVKELKVVLAPGP